MYKSFSYGFHQGTSMPHRSFRSRNFNSGKKHTHNPVFFRAKSKKSKRKGMHYYKMITNNNFKPLSRVFFCQQTFDFWLPLLPLWSDNDGTDSWQKRGFSWSMRKDNKEGEAREGRKSFWVDYIYLKAVEGLGTLY